MKTNSSAESDFTRPYAILIIDDSPEIIRVLGQILSDISTVIFALDGPQGLQKALAEDVDVILLDVEMPGMDGYEVCKRLKADPITKDIPVIFITGRTDAASEVKGLEAGAVDFIGKPLNPPVVRARMITHATKKRQSDMLKNLVNHDGLTGVHSRRFFESQFETEWRRHQRQKLSFAILMIDIDAFKNYNDAYGHLEGDICLRKVANALQSGVRRPGDFVARYGGEEFVAVLPHAIHEDALGLGQLICAEVAKLQIPHSHSSAGSFVSISVGASAMIPADELPPTTLVKYADKALYQAKEGGRNQCVFYFPPEKPKESV
ncbi:MAG: diguanylate cyclase [Phycisphaerae bacterium]|nr:diguanylate cyclase [Saprospiraceae bacterium]